MNGWQVFVEIAGRPPVELKPGESIIGRSRTAQVQVPDSTVSRQHARLLLGALGEVTVEDLGSSNGTIVNGNRVEGRQKLVDGDRILIGDAELRLRVVAPIAPSEATVRMVLPPMSAPHGASGMPPAAPPPPAMAPPQIAASPMAPPSIAPRPVVAPAPPMAPVPPSAAPSPLSLPLQVAPPPIAPPPIAPSRPAAPAAPLSTVAIASPSPFATPPVPLDVPPLAPPPAARPAPPPLAAPPMAPVPARPAPPPVPAISPRTGAARGAELPSVTMLDRLPIPQATPEVVHAARLARATPAGFWIRVVAALVDGALVGIVSAVLGAMIFFLPLPQAFGLMMMYVLSGALGLAYPLVFWATQGATPGKKLLGLTIVTAATKSTGGGIGWGTAILRVLGYFLSSALFGFGYLLVAFTSQKQGLHDLIASTRVVRVR